MAFYYVDFENVHTGGLKGIEKLCRKDEVYIFCRENDIKLIQEKLNERKIKAKVSCKIVKGTTKNALDFELISDMFMNYKGKGMIIVISKDKGYDAAINRAMCSGILCFRQSFIGEKGFETSLSYFWGKLKDIPIK